MWAQTNQGMFYTDDEQVAVARRTTSSHPCS